MPSKYTETSHSAVTIGSRKDWDKYLQEHLCKLPPRMRTPTPLTSIVIEETTELPVDSGVPASKKEQTMPTIKGFAPLVLALPIIAKPSPGFIQKGTPIIPTI